MKRSFAIILFLLLTQFLFAQQELTLYNQKSLLQSSFLNPANFQEANLNFAHPSVAFNFGNSGFSYSDLVRKNQNNDSLYLDVDNVISNLNNSNYIFTHVNLDYIFFKYRYKEFNFGFSFSDRTSLNIKYPKELIELAWNGNAQFLGESVNLGVGVKANRYREHSFVINRRSEKISIGTNLKYLSGIANISSHKTDIEIYTDEEDYSITLNSDYELNTSSLDKFSKIFPPFSLKNKNKGMAIDLGVNYDISKNVKISVSVLDMGFIKWKSDVYNYSSKGTYTFDGIDLAKIAFGDTIQFENYVDTLKNTFGLNKDSVSYTYRLVPKLYFGTQYKLDSNNRLNFLIYGENIYGFHPAFSVGYNHDFKRILGWDLDYSLGVSYSYKNRSYYNFGISNIIQHGNKRFFLIGDNLLSWLLPKAGIPLKKLDKNHKKDMVILIPKKLQNFNFRLGLNLMF